MFGLLAIILGLAGVGWYAERNTKAKIPQLPPSNNPPTQYAWVPNNGTLHAGRDYRTSAIGVNDEYGTPNMAVGMAFSAIANTMADNKKSFGVWSSVPGFVQYTIPPGGTPLPSQTPADWPDDSQDGNGDFILRTQFTASHNMQLPPVSGLMVWEWAPVA